MAGGGGEAGLGVGVVDSESWGVSKMGKLTEESEVLNLNSGVVKGTGRPLVMKQMGWRVSRVQ